MAGPYTRHNLYRNSPPGGKDELAGSPPGAPTKDSNTPTPSPAVFWAQTPTFTPTFTPALALPGGRYTNMDLQRATKLALESFVQDQAHA